MRKRGALERLGVDRALLIGLGTQQRHRVCRLPLRLLPRRPHRRRERRLMLCFSCLVALLKLFGRFVMAVSRLN